MRFRTALSSTLLLMLLGCNTATTQQKPLPAPNSPTAQGTPVLPSPPQQTPPISHSPLNIEGLQNVEASQKRIYVKRSIGTDIARAYMPHRRKINELVNAWLIQNAGVDFSYRSHRVPAAPRGLHIDLMSTDSFVDRMKAEEGHTEEQARRFQGYAQVAMAYRSRRINRGNVRIDEDDVKAAQNCPSRFVIAMAVTEIHEFGHAVLLYHPETVRGSRIPLYTGGRPNLMLHSVLSNLPIYNPDTDENEICEKSPDELTVDDLGVAPFHPIQRTQLHSTIGYGPTWRMLATKDFDFGDYMRFVRDSVIKSNPSPHPKCAAKSPVFQLPFGFRLQFPRPPCSSHPLPVYLP